MSFHGPTRRPDTPVIHRCRSARLSIVVVEDFLEVYIGTYSPAAWLDRKERARQPDLPAERPPQIATDEAVDWVALGLVPRWVGDDTSRSIVAIDASNFHGQGADEWRRYEAGVERRGELALYISMATKPERSNPHSTLFGTSSLDFPYLDSSDTFWILTEQIRLADPPELADDLTLTDRDLALRIRNAWPRDANWLALRPAANRPGDFFGRWTPLLLSPDGKALAGVWSDEGTSPGVPHLHYVLPEIPSYRPILQWLADRAVPDLIPTAAARGRRYVAHQADLQTFQERALSVELDELVADYERVRSELSARLNHERAAATAVRDPLLFGTSAALELAVVRVLTDAGAEVTRLDDELGTESGDLLAEYDGRRLLIEVKSSSGNASERLLEAPRRHLQTWSQLRPDRPVDGVVLVVNHQHKTPPSGRSLEVYQRRAFVDSLDIPVISTLDIFDLWRRGDQGSVLERFGFGPLPIRPLTSSDPAEPLVHPRRLAWWKRCREG